jgi:catechol 2,3-dioxygenase-like lactoylglutathione lyase family enzyme
VILDQINLIVSDMAATVDFYRLLGLEVPDTAPEWEAHHRTAVLPRGIDLDFDSLTFAKAWNSGATPGTGGAVIGFRVETRDDVDVTHRRMVGAGHRSQQDPYDTFWGARYAIVEDPDGNAVGLMSPIDPSRRAAPPSPD